MLWSIPHLGDKLKRCAFAGKSNCSNAANKAAWSSKGILFIDSIGTNQPYGARTRLG